MSQRNVQHALKLLGLFFLALPLSACSPSSAQGPAALPVVPAARVVRTDLSNVVTLTAEFEPYFEVDVMAKEAGYIHHMLVDIGDHVRQGQLLATLEIPELQDDLTKAKADVRTAQAEKASAQAELERAKAAQAIAQLSFSRIQEVGKKEPGLVPLEEVDVAHSHSLEAEAQLASAQQDVEASESRFESATAELAHENALVEYTKIAAPFTGVVTERYASDGSMIQAGIASQTQAMPVVKISENDLLRLMLPVPEEDAGSIHVGQEVEVSVPALGRSFPGKVSRFADRLQMSTRTMLVEVDVKNPKLTIIPGMYAEVGLDLADAKGANAVPLDAIDGTGANERLFVVDSSGVIHIRKATTGIASPQSVQVLSGAQQGDIVITGRHADYHDGQRVKPLVSTSGASSATSS